MLTILRGCPGSGKSTKAQEIISNNPGTLHYEADMFFEKNGVYKYVASEIGNAHIWCQNQVTRGLQDGHSVIVSNTFTKLKEFSYYIRTAQRMGIPYEVIHMTGNFKNIHGTPDEVIQRMKDHFQPYNP